jgi:hypothetical protein
MPSLQRFAAASGRSHYLSARIAREAFGLGLRLDRLDGG